MLSDEERRAEREAREAEEEKARSAKEAEKKRIAALKERALALPSLPDPEWTFEPAEVQARLANLSRWKRDAEQLCDQKDMHHLTSAMVEKLAHKSTPVPTANLIRLRKSPS